MATASVPTIVNILQFTKQSSTPGTAYKRFKANGLHAQVWYKNPIKPGTPWVLVKIRNQNADVSPRRAWKSLEIVRKIHIKINQRSAKVDKGIISQTDMALTQFLFMGFATLMPEQFGIVGSQEQFEAFSHFWRLIGYLLGTEDRFNCCGENLAETRRRLRSMTEDIFRQNLTKYDENFHKYTSTVWKGLWYSDPTIHYGKLISFM